VFFSFSGGENMYATPKKLNQTLAAPLVRRKFLALLKSSSVHAAVRIAHVGDGVQVLNIEGENVPNAKDAEAEEYCLGEVADLEGEVVEDVVDGCGILGTVVAEGDSGLGGIGGGGMG